MRNLFRLDLFPPRPLRIPTPRWHFLKTGQNSTSPTPGILTSCRDEVLSITPMQGESSVPEDLSGEIPAPADAPGSCGYSWLPHSQPHPPSSSPGLPPHLITSLLMWRGPGHGLRCAGSTAEHFVSWRFQLLTRSLWAGSCACARRGAQCPPSRTLPPSPLSKDRSTWTNEANRVKSEGVAECF